MLHGTCLFICVLLKNAEWPPRAGNKPTPAMSLFRIREFRRRGCATDVTWECTNGVTVRNPEQACAADINLAKKASPGCR